MSGASVEECLRTDLIGWEIGPYHAALPGPMKVRLALDGEVIVSGSVETGFMHRGLEKAIELHPWSAGTAYADRLDPEGAAACEMALCLAVEQVGDLAVPARAQAIRVILCEMGRICSHQGYLARFSRSVGAETMLHYVLRDREKLLDLFELLTGSRFMVNFLRYGGVAADVTEGFIERVFEACDLIQVRVAEYNDLLSFNRAFLKRTARVARITRERAVATGLSGPNLRACGVGFDVRKAHPYSGYEKLDFEVPVGRGEGGEPGDAHDRYLIRLREITQALDVLKQAVEGIPAGEFQNPKGGRDFRVPAGEAFVRVESARGMLGCYVVSDGGSAPCRVQFRVPSLAGVMLVPELVVGSRIEDLPVILSSLDIGVAEVDR